MNALKAGSSAIPLSALTDFIQYGYTAKSSSSAKGPKYLRITDIQDDHVEWTTVPKVSMASKELARYRLQVGDIVFARSGATVGKSFLIQDDPGEAVFASYLIRVRCTSGRLEPRYAALYFKSEDYWRQIRDGATGTGQPNFNGSKLGELRIPKRPLGEQLELVARLEALLKRSKNARDELVRVPRLVERYKQAILAAAFRGELTDAYRREKAPKEHENVAAEVARRRSEYFMKVGTKERPAASPTWKPAILLPPEWGWASVDQLSTVVQYGTSAKTLESLAKSVPVLRMGNIADGYLDYRTLKYLPSSHHEFPELLLQNGDILFNRTNSAELVGKTAVYFASGRPTSFASYLIRIQTVGYLPELLSAYINSEYGRAWVRSVVNQQVGQANVNGTKLKELGVPLIPMEEQAEIWSRIKKAFATIDRISNETSRAHGLLERLDQATLAKAFRGELAEARALEVRAKTGIRSGSVEA